MAVTIPCIIPAAAAVNLGANDGTISVQINCTINGERASGMIDIAMPASQINTFVAGAATLTLTQP